jgi:hypothetical protein
MGARASLRSGVGGAEHPPSRGCLPNAVQRARGQIISKRQLCARAMQQMHDKLGIASTSCFGCQEFYAPQFGYPPDVPT